MVGQNKETKGAEWKERGEGESRRQMNGKFKDDSDLWD